MLIVKNLDLQRCSMPMLLATNSNFWQDNVHLSQILLRQVRLAHTATAKTRWILPKWLFAFCNKGGLGEINLSCDLTTCSYCSVLFCSVLGPMHLFMKTQIIHRLTNEKHLSESPFLAPFPQDGLRINYFTFFLERIQQFGRWGSRCYPHGQREVRYHLFFDDIGKNTNTSAFSIKIKADWDQPLKFAELLMMFFSTLESYC